MKTSIWLKLMEIGSKLGCHQMPSRSFFYKGFQLPVCARCSGVIIATILGIPLFFVFEIPLVFALLMCSVMLIDWLLQYLKIKESTNIRRLITGLIGGYGLTMIYMYVYKLVVLWIIRLL